MNRGCHYEQKRYTTTKTDTQHQNCETQTLKSEATQAASEDFKNMSKYTL